MDKWLELRIFRPREENQQIIRSFVDPLVKFCDTFGGFTSFHFLSEDGKAPHLLLRIYGNEEVLKDQIKPWMEKEIDELELNGKFTPIGVYPGEEEAFGKEGWLVTYKIFEWASRGELIRLNSDVLKGRLFNEGKLLHCFLNCWGYSIADEFLFHLRSSLERMLVSRGIISPSQEDIKNMIKELDEKVPPIISDIINKHHISARAQSIS